MIRNGHSLPRSERGAALLAALCFTAVMGIAVASYQAMAYYTMKTGAAGTQSTRSLEVAEAGLEEALYALNNSTWTGWTLSGGNATKTVSGFTFDSGATGSVTITVTGYAAAKPTMTAVGTSTDSSGATITRTLTASTGASSTSTTGKAPLFSNAIAAVGTNASGTGNILLYYTGITVDSFDGSTGSAYSTGSAGYSAVLTAQASGSDASANSSTSSSIGTVVFNAAATVKGYVATTPTSGGAAAFTYASGSKVIGTSAGTGVDTTRVSTSAYQPSFTIATPSGAGTYITAPTGTVNIGTAGATSPTLYYATIDSNGNFDIENSGNLEIDGPVNLVINGNFYVGAYYGGGAVKINAGGSLQVFCSGYSYIAGGGINNTTYKPSNMAIFGTSSYSGYYTLFYTTTPFYGVIYSPNTDLYLYGRSTASAFMGSFVGRNAYVYNYASSVGIHYDTSLRDLSFSGVTTPYAVSSVTEQ